MPFVYFLRIFNAPEYLRDVKLGQTDQNLQDEEDVGHETEPAVDGGKMGGIMGELIVFDYDEGD